MKKRYGVSYAVLGMFTGSVLSACDSPTQPSEVGIEPALLEAVGDSVQLSVNESESGSWSWTSLNPSVVSVSSSGWAKGVAPGVAKVQATRRGRTAETEVRVLPDTDVRITTVGLQPDGPYQERLTLHLSNAGGRGFYRFEAWKNVEGAPPVRVLNHLTETPALVGEDWIHRVWLPIEDSGSGRAADFVVVFSRAGNSEAYTAWCALLHGQGACIIPN